MSQATTARHSLPNLFVGQAQKEITHNEALARIDALLHPVVEASLAAPPNALGPASDGLCWLIAPSATGVWAGKDKQIARWSGGSWRYLSPVVGMSIWLKNANKRLFYIGSSWVEPPPISNPSGGAVVDVEARAAIGAILAHLRQISDIPA
jgi:hypothetical protein